MGGRGGGGGGGGTSRLKGSSDPCVYRTLCLSNHRVMEQTPIHVHSCSTGLHRRFTVIINNSYKALFSNQS